MRLFMDVGHPQACDLHLQALSWSMLEMKRHKLGDTRAPSNDGRESNKFATQVRIRCGIVKAREIFIVQPRIHDAERGLALRHPVVIQQ